MSSKKASSTSLFTRSNRPGYLIFVALLFLAAFILVPRLDVFQQSLSNISDSTWWPLIIAASAVFLTYIAAAGALCALALRHLDFKTATLLQFASGFAAKLAPGGVGGFLINTRYLHRQKHNLVQAGAVMAVNGLLGFIGQCVIIVLALLFTANLGQTLNVNFSSPFWLIGAGILLMLPLILWLLKERLKNLVHDIKSVSSYYLSHPLRLVIGFVAASAVTLLFTSALYLCAYATGLVLNPLEVLVVYTAGTIGIVLTPTPAGLGGAEAALTTGLVGVGLEPAHAFAVALLYRGLSYWLPIIPGLICFQICLKRKYI